jgi:hypothetical protein
MGKQPRQGIVDGALDRATAGRIVEVGKTEQAPMGAAPLAVGVTVEAAIGLLTREQGLGPG